MHADHQAAKFSGEGRGRQKGKGEQELREPAA